MADGQKINYGIAGIQTARNQASGQVHSVPKRLPVSVVSIDKTNSIITLKFETAGSPFTLPNITVPLSGSEYIRFPITKGDKGFVTAADTNVGNMSGQGPNGPANFALPANLTPLIFTPFGNTNFTPTDDQTALLHYGPTGTINRDTNKKAKHIVHPTNGVTSQTGAQGQTGPTSNPTYNMSSLLHPLNGLLHTIKDSMNGDHTQSIVPQGGSGGPIGLLLSLFGGKHTHAIGQDGHKLTSSAKVDVTAPTTDINSSQTNISGNTSISGILSALGGMGAGAGGGAGGISPSGAVTGASVAVTGVAASNTVLTTPFTVAGLNAAYPPASNRGLRAYVIDVSGSPSWMTPPLTGGGAGVYPAFCNGTAWVAG